MKRELVTVDALLRLAAERGQAISARTLRHWSNRGLLPRAHRVAGGRSRWGYPEGTREQLGRLLRWRISSRKLHLIGIGIWFDGFAIAPADLRAFLMLAASELNEGFAAARADVFAGDGSVDEAAMRMARMRSGAPIARRVRMSEAERAGAYAYLISVTMGHAAELEANAHHLPELERMVGLRRGHGDGLAGELSIEGVPALGQLLSAASVKPVLASCSAEELELARRSVAAANAAIEAIVGDLARKDPVRSVDFAEVVTELIASPSPLALAVRALITLASLRAKNFSADELTALIETLDPATVDLELAETLAGKPLDLAISATARPG